MTGEQRFGKPRKGGKSDGSAKSGQAQNNVSFINIALSKEQSADCKAQEFSAEKCFDQLERLLEDNYKLAASFDSYHDCFSASLVPLGVDHVHSGYILSGKGSTALKAVKQLMYIHYQILDAQWPLERQQKRLDLDD